MWAQLALPEGYGDTLRVLFGLALLVGMLRFKPWRVLRPWFSEWGR